MVTEMKGVNALNLEPALPKLDEKTRSEWITSKQSTSDVSAANVSHIKREFVASLDKLGSGPNANRGNRENPPANVNQGQNTKQRTKVGNASVAPRGTAADDSKNAAFNFNAHAPSFTPTSGAGGQGQRKAEKEPDSRRERGDRSDGRRIEPSPRDFQPLVSDRDFKPENVDGFIGRAIRATEGDKSRARGEWPEATGEPILGTFGVANQNQHQVHLQLMQLRMQWAQRKGLMPPAHAGQAMMMGPDPGRMHGGAPMMMQQGMQGMPMVPQQMQQGPGGQQQMQMVPMAMPPMNQGPGMPGQQGPPGPPQQQAPPGPQGPQQGMMPQQPMQMMPVPGGMMPAPNMQQGMQGGMPMGGGPGGYPGGQNPGQGQQGQMPPGPGMQGMPNMDGQGMGQQGQQQFMYVQQVQMGPGGQMMVPMPGPGGGGPGGGPMMVPMPMQMQMQSPPPDGQHGMPQQQGGYPQGYPVGQNGMGGAPMVQGGQ
jgi:hypothetical protein